MTRETRWFLFCAGLLLAVFLATAMAVLELGSLSKILAALDG